MEQRYLFSHAPSSTKEWTLFVDGASKRNPGPAGVGIYLCNDSQVIVKQGFYLGKATNNQAEYMALLVGVWYAHQSMAQTDTLTIFSDSQLLVRQLKGSYAVKNHLLASLSTAVHLLLCDHHYEIQHIMRDHNSIADALANEGIKKKLPLPQKFLTKYHHLILLFS